MSSTETANKLRPALTGPKQIQTHRIRVVEYSGLSNSPKGKACGLKFSPAETIIHQVFHLPHKVSDRCT